MVAFEPICMPTMCFLKILKFWFCYECLKNLRRENFCTAYSVHVGDFLPHTQYTQEIIYRILSTRRRFFTACMDPIDLIFYRERASQPAKNETKEKQKGLEFVNQASKHACLHVLIKASQIAQGNPWRTQAPPPPLSIVNPQDQKLVIFRRRG